MWVHVSTVHTHSDLSTSRLDHVNILFSDWLLYTWQTCPQGEIAGNQPVCSNTVLAQHHSSFSTFRTCEVHLWCWAEAVRLLMTDMISLFFLFYVLIFLAMGGKWVQIYSLCHFYLSLQTPGHLLFYSEVMFWGRGCGKDVIKAF